jgi:hypothetical protein
VKRKQLPTLLLTVLIVTLVAVPALAIEQVGIIDEPNPNPPLNPDGSFPDGVTPEIIEVNSTAIMVPNPPDFQEVDDSAFWNRLLQKQEQSNKEIKVFVNGKPVSFPDQKPYFQDSRTMVPIRFVAEALGAEVDADEKGVVTIERGGVVIIHKIGTNNLTANGVTKTFDARSVLTKQFRTMVPLRFISEALGAEVDWDQATHTAYVKL